METRKIPFITKKWLESMSVRQWRMPEVYTRHRSTPRSYVIHMRVAEYASLPRAAACPLRSALRPMNRPVGIIIPMGI